MVGCESFQPRHARGGGASTQAPALHAPGISGTVALQQPENPAQASTQEIERSVEQEQEWAPVIITTESPIVASSTVPDVNHNQDRVAKTTASGTVPARSITRTTERIKTHLGAAQKDSSREIAAQIGSMRPVQWVGIALIAAALAMFWGPVRVVTQSTTLQVFTGAAGLILIFLPLIIVANPRLFAVAAVAGIAAPAIYFFVHRHGRMQGFIDANKDGVDDRAQTPNRHANIPPAR